MMQQTLLTAWVGGGGCGAGGGLRLRELCDEIVHELRDFSLEHHSAARSAQHRHCTSQELSSQMANDTRVGS